MQTGERMNEGTVFYVDQEARDMASRAVSMIEAHERVCTERAIAATQWRGGADAKLDGITNAVRGLYGRFWAGAMALIGGLCLVVGYLIMHKGL